MALFKDITSADNPQFKQLKKLASASRERRKQGQTLLDGVHLLQALAASGGKPLQLVLRAGAEEVPEIAACLQSFAEVPRLRMPASLYDQLSPVEHATGILALITIPAPIGSRQGSALLLENIQDPGNMGSILRSAAAAGIDAVYLSPGCAEAWSPKALRAGMGAQFAVQVFEQQTLVDVAQRYPTVIATTLDAQQSLYATDLCGEVAFVFGNEGAGLSQEILGLANRCVTIPMPGAVESLNVAAAVAICLFERVRQLQN